MKKRKKTGELEMFLELWEERPHICEVCGERLPWFDVRLCAHLMGKGALVQARLDKDNIALMCWPHHYTFDMETNRAVTDPRYDHIFERKEKIKQKYLNKDYGRE